MTQWRREIAARILLTIMVFAASIGAVGVAAAVNPDIAALEHTDNQPEPTNGTAAAAAASEAGSGVIIEIAPDSLPAIATWTRFNDDGSLTVYGVFENNSDRPITLIHRTAEFFTGDGILIAQRNSMVGNFLRPRQFLVYPGDRIIDWVTLPVEDDDSEVVGSAEKVVYGVYALNAGDANRQGLIVHSLQFSTGPRSIGLDGFWTNLSSSVSESQAFQLLFYKGAELIAWGSAQGSELIAPGASRRWSGSVNTVDETVTIQDLQQATVVLAGNGYFSEKPPEGRELVAPPPSEVTIEKTPEGLPLSKAWTRFDDDGNLTVYGIFVNDKDYPIRLNHENVTYLTADGFVLQSRNVWGTIFNPYNMVIYPGERVLDQSTFYYAGITDPETVALTGHIRYGLSGDRVVSESRPDIAIHSFEVVERRPGTLEASFLRTNFSAEIHQSQAFQILFIVDDDEVIAWAPAYIPQPIGPGSTQKWSIQIFPLHENVDAEELVQATVVLAGDAIYAPELTGQYEPTANADVAERRDITIEEVPGLHAVELNAHFDDEGSVIVYGVFENRTDVPVVANQLTLEFYAEDGSTIVSRSGRGGVLPVDMIIYPGDRVVHHTKFDANQSDPATVALTSHIQYGIQVSQHSNAERADIVLHSLQFETSGNIPRVTLQRTNNSRTLQTDHRFQMLFVLEDKLIGWINTWSTDPIAPGSTQTRNYRITLVNDDISFEDLRKAAIWVAGDAYYNEDFNPTDSLDGAVAETGGAGIAIEIASGSLPAVAAWTRFNENGNLTVYGVFENNSDRPVTVSRHTAEFYTADGIWLGWGTALSGRPSPQFGGISWG